jgi:hypothetical protein
VTCEICGNPINDRAMGHVCVDCKRLASRRLADYQRVRVEVIADEHRRVFRQHSERIKAMQQRMLAQGKTLGRRPNLALRRRLDDVAHLSVRKAAKVLGCSPVTLQKMRKEKRRSGG